jgi:hypothetical protein
MPQRSKIVLLTVAVLILTRLLAAQPNAEPLRAGDLFPQLRGQTLTSKSLELPTAACGKPAVVIFSFSRTAGKDARLWNEHVAGDFSNTVPGYMVIVLESVPKLFRGVVVSGIKSAMPPPVQDGAIVLYQDEKLWKLRLTAAYNDRAYVVLLGADGHLRWSNSEAFADSEYARLKSEIERLLQPRPGG